MKQIAQSLATCRDTPTDDSSQILDRLLDEIMCYEATYDPKLEIFYQALLIRINQKYDDEERKEEEPSTSPYTQQKVRIFCDDTVANNKSIRSESQNITEVTLQRDRMDDNDGNQLNHDAEVFHPRKLCTIHESEEEGSDDDEVVDDGLLNELESMKEDRLKYAGNEKKTVKKLTDKLEEMSDNNNDEITSSITPSPSPSSSEKSISSISVSPTSSISPYLVPSVINITNINNNNNNNNNNVLSPYIMPNIYGLPPLTNINCITTTNLNNPSCLILPVSSTPNLINSLYSIPMISNQSSSSVPNNQIFCDVSQQQHNNQENSTDGGFTKDCCFRRKYNNAAKGNFYISPAMICLMMKECLETFETDHVNDEKLAFGYYKESVAMQINDEQINDIIMTNYGLIIIINIDLHFKDDEIMYLVANENDIKYREKVRWCISYFMRNHEIYNKYGIPSDQLPLSSRNMKYFKKSINNPPINVSSKIVQYTKFKNLPKKTSKRDKTSKRGIKINENTLKYYCFKNWNKSPIIPVVVIKGKRQWIEWKKMIEIYDDGYNGYNNSESLWIGISMKYCGSNKKWMIGCIDYDGGRIYYQHRLIGNNNNKYTISYNQLSKFVNTELDII